MKLRQLKELVSKEILVLMRDRQTIPILFIMPVALIFFLSLAMQGVYTEKVIGQKISVVIETAGPSSKSILLEKKISAHKLVQRVERPQGMDNNRLFESGRAHVVIYIPDGFESGSRPVEMEFDPVLDAGYKAATRSLITGLTASVVMGIDDMEAMAANFVTEKTKSNKTVPSPLQQTVPGWAIFAMFFIAVPMSIGFLREKNDGTLQRLFTYPVGTTLVILAKLIPYYLINVVQFALMLVVGIWIMPWVIKMPLSMGNHPWHLIPVTVVVAAASTGFGVMVAALARTPEQSSALAATAAVLMAAFGGIMVPHVVMPLVMKKLAMISPMYWAHQAYLDVFLREVDFSMIVPKLVILTLFASVFFCTAGRKVKWM